MPTVIKEDGSIVPGANSYIDVADYKAYFATLNIDVITGVTDAQIEGALIDTGSNLLEYEYTYLGTLTDDTAPQALSFPRAGLIDHRGLVISDNTIPEALKKAQNEWVRAQIVNGRTAYTDTINIDNKGAVIKSKLEVLETTYAGPGSSGKTYTTLGQYLNHLLAPFIASKPSQFTVTNEATY